MTQEDVRAASDVVAGMLQMNDYQMHVLFDSGATHSFIANKNVKWSFRTLDIVKNLMSVQTVTVGNWTVTVQSQIVTIGSQTVTVQSQTVTVGKVRQ
jgi:hypothetical protein